MLKLTLELDSKDLQKLLQAFHHGKLAELGVVDVKVVSDEAKDQQQVSSDTPDSGCKPEQ